MFADDTSMVASAKNVEEFKEKVDTVINKFSNWRNANNLIVNEQKTVYINFCASQVKQQVRLNNLTPAGEVKLLGKY